MARKKAKKKAARKNDTANAVIVWLEDFFKAKPKSKKSASRKKSTSRKKAAKSKKTTRSTAKKSKSRSRRAKLYAK